MPIYEYQCKNCGFIFEQLQKVTDEPLVECPECHNPALYKLVSATSFKLKGSGWYVTDFKDKGKKADNKESKSEPKKETEKKDKPKEDKKPKDEKN